MKGLAPLFLGIFGTFAFSWIGLTVIPTWQIGHLNPESDEEGTDIYPRPQSGMFKQGEHVYAANGCVYCHSSTSPRRLHRRRYREKMGHSPQRAARLHF